MDKKNLILIVIVIFVFFIFFEIILRIFGTPVYGFQEGMFTPDAVLGYQLSSNFSGDHSIYERTVKVDINSEGMRDFREYSYEKSKPRILILGSSYAFGNGVEFEETYIEKLREKFDNKIEILNLAVPGYTLAHKYTIFLKKGKKYDPNIIFIQTTPGDWGNYKIELNNVDKNGILISPGGKGLRSIHLSLLKNLRSYSFVYAKSRNFLSFFVTKYWEKDGNVPLFFLEENSTAYEKAFEEYYLILNKLKENTDAQIILFISPSKYDLISKEEVKQKYHLNYSPDISQLEKSLEKIAVSLNISIIKVDFDDPNLFFKIDRHWTPEGNEIVADKVYQKLQKIIDN